MRGRIFQRWVAGFWVLGLLWGPGAAAWGQAGVGVAAPGQTNVASLGTNTLAAITNGITLRETIRRVLDFNESIQNRIIALEISRNKVQMERGVFEPQFVGAFERTENTKQNTVQQQLSTFTSLFDEQNIIYQGALEFLTPSGAQLRMGYTLRDLSNNLQRNRNTGDEYETFVGASLVQPLLKNFGPASTMAKIRLAAIDSDIAYEDYRRQLMLVIARAEIAYWDLYLAQEQVRISEESITLAETILRDNRARLEAGRSSDLEVLEAQAGVALRLFRRNDAQQRHFDSVNRLTTLYSLSALETNLMVSALDQPKADEVPMRLFDSYQEAFELNPDYLTQRKQLIQENIRLAYAKNQRWPQLDLRASYGLNGLGEDPQSSWRQVDKADFPTWSVGLEMRIPLAGGLRERRQLDVARLTQRQALNTLKEIELQIVNGIDFAMRKARSFRDNIAGQQSVVEFNQQLFKTQLERLGLGRTDSRTVLETEEKLSQARLAMIESVVQYQKALLEFELLRGTMLRDRELEVSKRDLLNRTAALVRGDVSDQVLQNLFQEVRGRYPKGPMAPEGEGKAVKALRETMRQLGPDYHAQPPANADEIDQALELLRQKMNELDRRDPPPPSQRGVRPAPSAELDKALQQLREKMNELNRQP